MYNHEPKDYDCPFCSLVLGQDDEINKQEYIVYQNDSTLAYVSPKWWINNPGHVLVVPKKHVENIYNIPDELLGDVYKTAKKIAIAIKETYESDGTSMRQHNEPAGNQDVWHFHVHVFPRFANDELYKNHDNKRWVEHAERMEFVKKLKRYFSRQESK
ncbi:MAG TPA: HIT domain-containing protein [Patescibacteria group bacterium]|nr:HIT domain-containing protein [Patescibacteria group bacterium]